MGPMFRHERPQRGRYRQFHQFGMEAMGFKGPDTDAEQLLMLNRLWKRPRIAPVRLELNCLGQLEDRKAYREVLIKYFEAHKDILMKMRHVVFIPTRLHSRHQEPRHAGLGQ